MRRLRRWLRPSIRALLAHRVRAALALASVAIGVASVVLTSAIGAGAQSEVLRRMDGMGTNLLIVRPAQVKRFVGRAAIRGTVTSLRVDDYDAIAQLAAVADAAPGVESALRVKAGNGGMICSVLGTSPSFPRVRRVRLRDGRFFNLEDDVGANRVAVLGSRVAETLFPDEDSIGQAIRIRGVPFEVIGTTVSKGITADGSDEDNKVFIPMRTALRRVFNIVWLNTVFVSVRELDEMDDAERAIGGLLRVRHRLDVEGRVKPDDFAIQNTTRSLSAQRMTAEALTQLTSGLAAIALLVGGIGVLALMLLSLKERTSEIGLRMAVGARPRDILIQFLAEAAMLALGGWLAGVAVGGLAAAAVGFGTSWPVAAPVDALLGSLAMAVVTGLGFGAFPARAASLLPPIDALRAE